MQELNEQRLGDPASWRLWEKRLSSGRWGAKPWLFSSRLANGSILRVDIKGIKTGFAGKPALSHLEKTGSLCHLSTCGGNQCPAPGFLRIPRGVPLSPLAPLVLGYCRDPLTSPRTEDAPLALSYDPPACPWSSSQDAPIIAHAAGVRSTCHCRFQGSGSTGHQES